MVGEGVTAAGGRPHAEEAALDAAGFAKASGFNFDCSHMEWQGVSGVDFIRATREIKRLCRGAKVSGGVSNIAFSFRGNEPVRRAFHSAFLHHACAAGMDMGIVNAAQVGWGL